MTSDAHGRFHWNELLTNDVEAAKAFFADLMEWEYDKMTGPDGTYFVAIKQNHPVCAIAPMPSDLPSSMSPQWISYIEVDNIDDCVVRAKAAGASAVREPYDVPEVGRIALVRDPTGAILGWVTPDFND